MKELIEKADSRLIILDFSFSQNKFIQVSQANWDIKIERES